MSRSVPKAAHYVLALDGARCEGDWDAVPEYVRKVRKHAAGRACLTLTAETELAIEKATRNTPAARTDATTPTKGLDVVGLLPKLQAVIEEETHFLQDRFQARVCIGWLHWVAGDYDSALATLPGNLNDELAKSDELGDGPVSNTATDWTRVCALKSAYLRANCLARKTKRKEALAVFQSELPCITLSSTAQQHWQQLRYWSELFLTEYCMLQSHTLEQGETTLADPNCLVSLRAWARYWGGTAGSAQLGGSGFRGSVPRRRIWFEYYSVLTALLEDDLPVPAPTSDVAGDGSADQTSTRSQLRVELKKVEAIYEALLLEETSFPRAEDEREEVEAFVRLVMQNWSVLKGRGWRDSDLGQGGKESASRGVLDILYRASTKTYHSTAILRYLFTVHLAVAEFDLAFKAFDSYFGLIKKGKARVIKTGKDEPSLDEDEVVLETLSLCIVALCRYGDRKGAEKAYNLGQELEECLLELSHGAIPEQEDDEAGNPTTLALPKTTLVAKTKGTDVPLRIVALAWQAVGLSLAQWSRMSFDSTSRTTIQAKAVRCLRKSLSQEYGRTANLRGVFSLGLLLAEQRELGAAIDLVKGALLSGKAPDADQDFLNGPYWRERAMIPLWHLLSLLMSARQDYVMAARACEGAFEQFKDLSTLFGSEHVYRSEHLNEAEATEEKNGHWTLGLVDEMEDFEKERILEVKMTQLALVELLESPKVAVNASLELLSLYARLFGPPQSGNTKSGNLLQPPKASEVPKSSAGTLRSIKGSIFGRSGRPATKAGATGASEKPPSTSANSRPQTTQTVTSSRGDGAPTIQVTKDFEEFRRARKSSGPTYERRSQSGKRNSLRKRDSSGSRRRAVSSGGVHVPSVVDGEAFFTPFDESGQANAGGDFFSAASTAASSPPTGSSRRRLSVTGGVAAPPISLSRQASQVDSLTAAAVAARTGTSSSLSTSSAATGAIADLAPEGVETSLSLMPLIQFSEEHEKRRRSTILIEVWLMIAGFYRRAEMFDDAKRSAAEAQKLVQELEMDVARSTSGNGSSTRNRTWVGKKTVDELWGDVWSEMGYLSLDKGNAHTARLEFETALTHFADHPAATIGLSNILLDVYSEKLVMPHAIPRLELADGTMFPPTKNTGEGNNVEVGVVATLPSRPLGLASSPSTDVSNSVKLKTQTSSPSITTPVIDRDFANLSINAPAAPAPKSDAEQLPPPYKATSLPLNDRLASRDRAFALLSGLTKLGSSWNNAEAWFALARAHEESGQPDKAKEVLWWCVELEESAGVRPWGSVATGGYIL
ncbi:filamentation protein [Ophiostoma piceae UAMH 11346]|uniref:Filamentation protein n=1 Tax=Ophiostoma piceae (strain UAMH 11346) TaxID=1262450 RepID=S3CE00_OPHP1|nr:filamentation protein [Ophiostoma piceae UAMH 11346]